MQPAAEPTPTPTPTPTATPTATPNATPATAARSPCPTTLPAAPGSDPLLGDLGSVPGSLVSDTSCQQLAGNAKYRRLKLRGIGTVRVRAYTAGPATQLTPILVTTQISHGKAKRVKVRYTLDGRKLRAGRKPSYKAAITPSLLQRIGIHKLKATVTAQGQAQARQADRAQAQDRLVPHALHRAALADDGGRRPAPADRRADRARPPRLQGAGRAAAAPDRQAAHGRLHARLRRRPEPAQALRPQARQEGPRQVCCSRRAGKPVVRYVRGGLEVRGLPARSAVAELTIYRVTKRDGATKRKRFRLKAQVMRPGARALSLSVRPRFQR